VGGAAWIKAVQDGQTPHVDTGIPITPKGISALYAALNAASKKAAVTDCLAGQSEGVIDSQIGLTPALGGKTVHATSPGPNMAALKGVSLPNFISTVVTPPKPPVPKKSPLIPPRMVKPLVATGGTVLASLLGWAIFHKPSTTPRL
jgi:hypothetical protein